jgi:histone deacetylase 6
MHYYMTILLTAFTLDACTEPESPIECLIGFVADCSINSIKRPADDDIGSWYHRVS